MVIRHTFLIIIWDSYQSTEWVIHIHILHTPIYLRNFFHFMKSSLTLALVTTHLLDVNQLNWDPVKYFILKPLQHSNLGQKHLHNFLKPCTCWSQLLQEVLMPSVLPKAPKRISWDLLLTHLHTTPRRINSIRLFKNKLATVSWLAVLQEALGWDGNGWDQKFFHHPLASC